MKTPTDINLKNLLAINGGEKFRNTPWPPRFLFDESDKHAVMTLFDRAIASGQAFGYDEEEESAYCKEFAEFHGGGFADAVNSGTTAIYVALRALEIEPFTEVIVPPITDSGGVMPVPLMNCIPIVADSEPDSFNMGAEQIEARITERTSAIIVAHIFGAPVDMDPVMEVARSRGIPVIEDCAQAHGAKYKGRYVGTLGDIGAFSTMSGKHHATGSQGGVVFTQNEDLYWRARRYSDRGKPFGLSDWTVPSSSLYCSMNFNLGDFSACVGRTQLQKLSGAVARRRQYAIAVAEACQSLQSVSVDLGRPDTEGSFWFLPIKLHEDRISATKAEFVAALAAEGLPVIKDYLNLLTNAPWYKNRAVFGTSGYPWTSSLYKGDADQKYPVPNACHTNASHFPLAMHENLTDQEIQDTLAIFQKVENAFLNS